MNPTENNEASDRTSEINPAAYLSMLLSPLLGFPDELRVDSQDDERGTLLTLEVNPADMGRVIGKNGETARSFRRLVRQFGMSRGTKVSIRITDPQREGGFAELDETTRSE